MVIGLSSALGKFSKVGQLCEKTGWAKNHFRRIGFVKNFRICEKTQGRKQLIFSGGRMIVTLLLHHFRGRKNGCRLLLYLVNKHYFENFGGAIA